MMRRSFCVYVLAAAAYHFPMSVKDSRAGVNKQTPF